MTDEHKIPNRLQILRNSQRLSWDQINDAMRIIEEFIDLLDVLKIEVMHPHMNGEHQFTVGGTHGCLTNAQWRLVYEARECME